MPKPYPLPVPDWGVITTRWVFLVAASLWLATGNDYNLSVWFVFVLAGFANILWTLLLAFCRKKKIVTLASALIDLLISIVLFAFLSPLGAAYLLILAIAHALAQLATHFQQTPDPAVHPDIPDVMERTLELQGNSRRKLARELHDGPTQTIAAIAMRVNFARRLMEKDPQAALEELKKTEDLARQTTREIRRVLFLLHPLVLESHGLGAALGSLAEKEKETHHQDVSVEADQAAIDSLDRRKQTEIFYIAEEAVNNARRHAQASRIAVSLKLLGDDLCYLEIEDDGAGFIPGATGTNLDNHSNLGMQNMRERTELMGGIFEIVSSIDTGTRIKVTIPLTDAAADRLQRGV